MKCHGCYLSFLKHQKPLDELHFLAADIGLVSEAAEVTDQAGEGGEDLEGQGHLRAAFPVHL